MLEISYVFSRNYKISPCVNPPCSSVRFRDFFPFGLLSVTLQDNDSLVHGGGVGIGLNVREKSDPE